MRSHLMPDFTYIYANVNATNFALHTHYIANKSSKNKFKPICTVRYHRACIMAAAATPRQSPVIAQPALFRVVVTMINRSRTQKKTFSLHEFSEKNFIRWHCAQTHFNLPSHPPTINDYKVQFSHIYI